MKTLGLFSSAKIGTVAGGAEVDVFPVLFDGGIDVDCFAAFERVILPSILAYERLNV